MYVSNILFGNSHIENTEWMADLGAKVVWMIMVNGQYKLCCYVNKFGMLICVLFMWMLITSHDYVVRKHSSAADCISYKVS